MSEWIKNLKVGDKVFVDSRYGSELTIIEQITKAGNLKIKNGLIFMPNGRERGGDKWNILTLREATHEAIDAHRKNLVKRKAIRIMKETKAISYEKAIKIIELLASNESEDTE